MRVLRLNLASLLTLSLVAAVMLSALGVVSAKHQARTSFVQLQALQNARDEMQVAWGRLQLEQAAWSTHGRIEQIARSQLNMQTPNDKTVVTVVDTQR